MDPVVLRGYFEFFDVFVREEGSDFIQFVSLLDGFLIVLVCVLTAGSKDDNSSHD